MKPINVTEEQYNALLALGVIKEEPTATDPHKGFVVGKKYKFKHNKAADVYAYYCGIKDGWQVCEITKDSPPGSGLNIHQSHIPDDWISKGSGQYWVQKNFHLDFDPTPIEEGIQPFEGTKWVRIERVDKADKSICWYAERIGEVFEVEYWSKTKYHAVIGKKFIDFTDCTEVEAPAKELKAWEKYPTLESCWEEGEYAYGIIWTGKIKQDIVYDDVYHYSTEAEAKKARATIFLSRIARKWNEGVEIENDRPWFITESLWATWSAMDSSYTKVLPFYFHTKELAEKSLEMFKEQWDDFYNK